MIVDFLTQFYLNKSVQLSFNSFFTIIETCHIKAKFEDNEDLNKLIKIDEAVKMGLTTFNGANENDEKKINAVSAFF